MELCQKIIEFFDQHSGFEAILSLIAIVLSTIPYIAKMFKNRFHLYTDVIAYRIFNFSHENSIDNSQRYLAIQLAVTNLSERPCTITKMLLNIDGNRKHISYVSERIFEVNLKGVLQGEYCSVSLPQHLAPHSGTCGCFIVPNFDVCEEKLKSAKCRIEIICGKKKKKVCVDFSKIETPLVL